MIPAMQTVQLPPAVDIVDVCPRDGLQNLKNFVPTAVKCRLVDRLLDAGLRQIEVTSFVSPKAIPQMADAAEVAAYALSRAGEGTRIAALAPNTRGAKGAWDAGLREINYVMSMSEAHNKANINRTHAQSLDALKEIVDSLPHMRVNLAAATVFGCPFDGEVPLEKTLDLFEQVVAQGIRLITLSDTIGVATPLQVTAVVAAVRARFPQVELGLHMHDTHGMGLANAFAGMLAGITRFEGATGGLGGCPFAPGAAGNTATEDMVNMFARMGVRTGIDTGKLVEVVGMIRETGTSPATNSHLGCARSYAEFSFHTPSTV